jgi:hypothetical protein
MFHPRKPCKGGFSWGAVSHGKVTLGMTGKPATKLPLAKPLTFLYGEGLWQVRYKETSIFFFKEAHASRYKKYGRDVVLLAKECRHQLVLCVGVVNEIYEKRSLFIEGKEKVLKRLGIGHELFKRDGEISGGIGNR